MSVNKIAGRYAKSLLDLAIEQNVLDTVTKDMETFVKMVENRDLYLLLKSPIINASKKQSVFNVLVGEKFHKLTNAFISIVLRKGREAYLPEISKEYLNQYREHIGLTSVKLTTASPIDEATLAAIKTKLISSKETAKDVEITTHVNPEIVGGFILQIGDKLFDNSIAHKLNQLRKNVANKDFIKTI